MNRIEHCGAVINASNRMGNVFRWGNRGRVRTDRRFSPIAGTLDCGAIAILQIGALPRNAGSL